MSLKPLRPGDRVAVLSPAGPVLPENIDLGIKTLIEWGLEVDLLEPYLRDRGYLAGSDSARHAMVQHALDGGFFPDGGHTPEKWMSYDGAQTVDGVVFPERFRTFAWDGKTHGELATNTTMTEVSWVRETSFEVPAGAKILEGF